LAANNRLAVLAGGAADASAGDSAGGRLDDCGA